MTRRIDPWRMLGAAIVLVAGAFGAALLIVAVWAIAPYVAQALR